MYQIWSVKLYDDSYAVLLVNIGSNSLNITVTWKEIGFNQKYMKVRDLWKHEDLGYIQYNYTVNIESHDSVFLKISTPIYTPPMGFFYETEGNNKNWIDNYIETGLSDVGYKYIILSSNWGIADTNSGGVTVNTQIFHNGDQDLIDLVKYAHAKNLLFGLIHNNAEYKSIYIQNYENYDIDYLYHIYPSNIAGVYDASFGKMTLQVSNNEVTGRYDHEGGQIEGMLSGNILNGRWYQLGNGSSGRIKFTFTTDFSSFTGLWSENDASELNNDGWNGNKISDLSLNVYENMNQGLNQNKLFYAIDNVNDPESIKNIANSWKTSTISPNTFTNIKAIMDINDEYYQLSSSGHYNDPGILNTGLNDIDIIEFKTQFGLWSICKTPLIIGSALNELRDDVKEILKNEEIIEINQDILGIQGHKIKES